MQYDVKDIHLAEKGQQRILRFGVELVRALIALERVGGALEFLQGPAAQHLDGGGIRVEVFRAARLHRLRELETALRALERVALHPDGGREEELAKRLDGCPTRHRVVAQIEHAARLQLARGESEHRASFGG